MIETIFTWLSVFAVIAFIANLERIFDTDDYGISDDDSEFSDLL